MQKVNVTDFRQHLQGYLKLVRDGEPIQITLHGQIVARLIPETDVTEEAQVALAKIRETATVGDLISPIDAEWEAERDHL